MAFLTSSKQKFRSRRALWFALGATTFIGSGPTACGLAEGLSDVGSSLANPDAALLDSPGRPLRGRSLRQVRSRTRT